MDSNGYNPYDIVIIHRPFNNWIFCGATTMSWSSAMTRNPTRAHHPGNCWDPVLCECGWSGIWGRPGKFGFSVGGEVNGEPWTELRWFLYCWYNQWHVMGRSATNWSEFSGLKPKSWCSNRNDDPNDKHIHHPFWCGRYMIRSPRKTNRTSIRCIYDSPCDGQNPCWLIIIWDIPGMGLYSPLRIRYIYTHNIIYI